MTDEDRKINEKLIKLLSEEEGIFGHVPTWGYSLKPYEYVGYEFSEDLLPCLNKMNHDQRKNLSLTMFYFEIHAKPLRLLLEARQNDSSFKTMFYEMAWSHFMTVVMFGMLEIAVKISPVAMYNKRGFLKKQESIKSFLELNLSQPLKEDIVRRYSSSSYSEKKIKFNTFSEVFDHLWLQIRSGFIHDGSFESKGLEWTQLSGTGTKADPIKVGLDVPMQEWMQITWQAILHSYGYDGILKLLKYKEKVKTT